MKVAISCEDPNPEGTIDQRFGRCKYFFIADIENNTLAKTEAVQNSGSQQDHGAGTKAAEQLGNLGVDAVITGNIGPKAAEVLDKLDIKQYIASGNIKDAVHAFMEGKLEQMNPTGIMTEESETSTSDHERIFFPLLEDNGKDSRISQHFGHAPFFGVYDTKEKTLKILKNELDHKNPDKSPIDQIEESVNPTMIFAKGIGERAIEIISRKGLRLRTGDYKTVREAIDNLDKLEMQPESCGHDHQGCGSDVE